MSRFEDALNSNGDAIDPVRRALLQAAGISLVASSCLRRLSAANARPVTTDAIDSIDFRYSPPWWQTSICMPDDPDKALVGREGQLLFDWGAQVEDGGRSFVAIQGLDLSSFGILLQPDLVGGTNWIRQTTVSPRVPIIETWRNSEGIEVCEQTFLVTPEPGEKVAVPLLARTDFPGFMTYRWTEPTRQCSPAFYDAAIGDAVMRAPIHFQLAVPPGASVTVVYGLCEGCNTLAGARVLVLSADGGAPKVVDPVKDFGVNQPGIYKLTARDENRDGIINIYVSTPDNSEHVPVLNALWAFTGEVPDDSDIIAGRGDGSAMASFPEIIRPPRRAIVLVRLQNTGAKSVTHQPQLRIRSVAPVTQKEGEPVIFVGSGMRIVGSSSLTLAATGMKGELAAQMPPVHLPPGGSCELVFTVDRHSLGSTISVNAEQARAFRAAAVKWWESYGLPYKAIKVPDQRIQGMLESCVRNIWQARELKIGGPAFQVGPTCYRGLWVVDGAFLLEAATLIGCGHDARSGLEYLISQQKSDGSFESIPRYWKENGIVLWAATRHALLTQDKEWLRRRWPALQRAMAAIRRLRGSVSGDPQALNYRLLPGGTVDGGISNVKEADPEYSNIHWSLIGMKSFIAAAHWLADGASAISAESEYTDFSTVFRRACARDVLNDSHGNAYVPTMMANAQKYVPQKGQWTFCHAVFPGELFSKDDPLVDGQLAMLRDSKVEGMVCDTGYLTRGIWTTFASFYAHAQLWQGRGDEAADSLYALVQHACPTRVWHEEQRLDRQALLPQDKGLDGDMPHNWVSAEFIRLTAHLIELDRGKELHLLEGFPQGWAGPGMVTAVDGVLTPFGPLHLEICVAEDGRSARLKLKQLPGSSLEKIILHLRGLAGRDTTIELPIDRDVEQVISLVKQA